MLIVDAIIFIALGFGALLGFKRGFFKQTVILIGVVLIFVLAFSFKNVVSIFLYEHLPFFNFDGVFAGVTSINILVYEMIAFLLVASVLVIIFRILLGISGLVEKVLNFTIILGIPSKILGAIVGIIEVYIYIFVFIYILSLPVLNFKFIEQSNMRDVILEKTPIISNAADQSVQSFKEIYSLKEEFVGSTDSNELNLRVLDILLKNKIVSIKSVEKLYSSGKLKVSGINEVISKYK